MTVAVRTRQSKEEGHIPLLADVAARMERQNVTLGHEVVHDGEHTLLHLSRVGRPCVLVYASIYMCMYML